MNLETFVNPKEPLIDSLKQEIYELQILNRHIKQRNETLNEQNKLAKEIHDNTILHLGFWYKKNKKLKRNNKILNRIAINLKYLLLMRIPRMTVTSKKRKGRKLDLLAEVSK